MLFEISVRLCALPYMAIRKLWHLPIQTHFDSFDKLASSKTENLGTYKAIYLDSRAFSPSLPLPLAYQIVFCGPFVNHDGC